MRALWSRMFDALRGAAIGVAEIIPGVSGGTIALLVGLYDTLISSAARIVRALRGVVSPAWRQSDWAAFRAIPWWRLLAIAVGMLGGIVAGAALIEPLITDQPVLTRAFFAGLILASILVPLGMVGWPPRPGEPLLFVLVAGSVFLLLGLPPLTVTDPPGLVVVGSAAIAVCALVLPGVSGSFLLLSLGLYQPTLAAVNDRDLGYLGLFILGAVFGLGSFVLVLQWLLTRFRRITLVVMAGLLAGSLRALWPWQSESRELLAPVGTDAFAAVGFALLGVGIVMGLLALERGRRARQETSG